MDSTTVSVDPSNEQQASSWNGEDGQYWASHHREYERLLAVFDGLLVEAAEVRAEDRCLDIGCGTGPTSFALAGRAVEGSVLGLDLSAPSLAVARAAARRSGFGNVRFVQGDAQVYPFDPSAFDAAVSRMGSMFFGDPVAAFSNIGRALRPGGRLALAVWREASANEWITAIDEVVGDTGAQAEPAPETEGYAPGPFSLADPELCTSLLEGAGFVDVRLQALDLALTFGTVAEASAWLESWIEKELEGEGRARALAALQRLLEEKSTPEGVYLQSATWLVTARRPDHSRSPAP
jgi:SAM-dependent methyltransferase